MRGFAGGALMIGFGIPALLSPTPISDEGWLACGLDLLGWVTFIAAATFRFWSTLYIGGRKTHTLMDQGPYSVCRNPLYVGTFLLWLSAAIFFKSLTLVAGVVAGIVFYLLVTIPAEEVLLGEVLGEPYHDYCRRVPRLWPRWSLFRSPATINVSIVGLMMECRRAARWIWLPLAADTLAHLRSEPWWPIWFNLP